MTPIDYCLKLRILIICQSNYRRLINQKILEDFSIDAKSLQVDAIYEHYKGMQYKVLHIARQNQDLKRKHEYFGAN
jgi:hypothetical protein